MAKTERVVIQRTTGVTLRVTVEVLRCDLTRRWFVRWLSDEAIPLDKSRAIAVAMGVATCKALAGWGIDSELIIRRVNGTVGERRTYGRDPRRVRG